MIGKLFLQSLFVFLISLDSILSTGDFSPHDLRKLVLLKQSARFQVESKNTYAAPTSPEHMICSFDAQGQCVNTTYHLPVEQIIFTGSACNICSLLREGLISDPGLYCQELCQISAWVSCLSVWLLGQPADAMKWILSHLKLVRKIILDQQYCVYARADLVQQIIFHAQCKQTAIHWMMKDLIVCLLDPVPGVVARAFEMIRTDNLFWEILFFQIKQQKNLYAQSLADFIFLCPFALEKWFKLQPFEAFCWCNDLKNRWVFKCNNLSTILQANYISYLSGWLRANRKNLITWYQNKGGKEFFENLWMVKSTDNELIFKILHVFKRTFRFQYGNGDHDEIFKAFETALVKYCLKP